MATTITKRTTTRKAKSPANGSAATISDAAVTKATGKGWDHWFGVLDRFDVKKNGHKSAAAHVHDQHACPEWWSQMVVVEYEQARGLRAKHQRPDGYSVSASRVINAPLAGVYKAWQGKGPRLWLPGYEENGSFTVRTQTVNQSIRMLWCDGKTTVEVMFYDKSKPGAKSAAKSQVTVQHNKLASAAAGEKMKKYWGKALDGLKEMLER